MARRRCARRPRSSTRPAQCQSRKQTSGREVVRAVVVAAVCGAATTATGWLVKTLLHLAGVQVP
jgi:hypothetical protein